MYEEADRRLIAAELALAFLAGEEARAGGWRPELLAERGAGALDRRPAWMSALALHVCAAFRTAPVDRPQMLAIEIEDFLAALPVTLVEAGQEVVPPQAIRLLPAAPPHRPRRLVHDWPVARIDSVGELAERLELGGGQLAWLADVRGLERTVAAERLRNYRYRTLPRRDGPPRMIEIPKARLKEIQRWILREILDHIPPHPAAYGFVGGRSVIGHARVHSGRGAVLRLDLKDFFAAVAARRVDGIFRVAGYGPRVAHVLTGLCTNTVAQGAWLAVGPPRDAGLVGAYFNLGRQLATPHLPQGAPTSPALANLAAFRLDRRLSALAVTAGARYSRYADDLAFSWSRGLQISADGLHARAAEIIAAESFALNLRKSSLATAGGRQMVCGVVVNVRPNVTRAEYDRLKAILHNAARRGPATQNRANVADLEAHLRGRIEWVGSLHPARGEKLRRRFERIDWTR